MSRKKSLVSALVLVTFTMLAFGQTPALAWHGHGHGHGYRHHSSGSWLGGLFAATVATAVVESAARRADYEAPVRYFAEPATTTYVDPYGRLVIVRTVFDSVTGRWVRYSEFAR